MRIDAHQHFWDPSRFRYAWMPPPPSPLLRPFLPEDLAPILEKNRFDGSVAVQAHTSIEETDWLLELARHSPMVKGVVGWVDLEDPRLGVTLDRLQRDPKFRGVRHPVHDEEDQRWLMRPTVLDGLREVARRGLPFDLLIRPPHLNLVLPLVEHVPDLRLVIDHIAKPLIQAQVLDPWSEHLATVSRLPRVYCKLSGMITEADRDNWQSGHLAPYVDHVMRSFNPERLMFGSDWPVCLTAGTWKQVLAAFTRALGARPIGVREKILGLTAIEFYGLV
jgi:L-fuconolactonase